MSQLEPAVLSHRFNEVTANAELPTLAARLEYLLFGREPHAAHVELKAFRTGHETQIVWGDAYTGQALPFGTVAYYEAPVVVRTLFSQLRAWRERCEVRWRSAEQAEAVRWGTRVKAVGA